MLEGITTDFLKQPVGAEIMLLDKYKNLVAKSNSDSKTGKYSFTASVKEGIYYNLIFYASSFFPECESLNTNMAVNKHSFEINKEMTILQLGKPYPLFYASWREQDVCLPYYKCFPQLYGLNLLLQKNPNMNVLIEVHGDQNEIKDWELGHVGYIEHNYVLSAGIIPKVKGLHSIMEWRAAHLINSMKNYITSMDRIKVIASDKMIFPNPKNEDERRQNRQISITILSL